MNVNAKEDTRYLLTANQFVVAEEVACSTQNRVAMMLCAHVRALAASAVTWRMRQKQETELRLAQCRRNRNAGALLARASKRMSKTDLLKLVEQAREELVGEQGQIDDVLSGG